MNRVTKNYNGLVSVLINYLKLYIYVQTNANYQIELITWNHIIINVRKEYMKLYICALIVCIKSEYLISNKYVQKFLRKAQYKNVNINLKWTEFSNLLA